MGSTKQIALSPKYQKLDTSSQAKWEEHLEDSIATWESMAKTSVKILGTQDIVARAIKS